MFIKDMFVKDVDRQINGVIKVTQDAPEVIEQEVREYVITRELKKHFINFFNYYSDAFDEPTDDIGVWISGFFGSGKSHFLKMLSYILENKQVGDTSTVEVFREKFEDDAASFMSIDKATQGVTETILFNIDIVSDANKQSVPDVFAKVFYRHLGFYGDDLKIVRLEQYIELEGKTEEFRRVIKQMTNGRSWEELRKMYAFYGNYIIPALVEVLGMNETDAKNWFDDKNPQSLAIDNLVADIGTYVSSKPNNYRLLFMIDEVGQYVGSNTNMLLNLQSIVEEIGSSCGGKVWVMCTGQEGIDEIIKVPSDEFSRIQARFKTRLSLSSSSVDEVIQKRILKKNKEAEQRLEALYDENESVLRNLLSFKDAIGDIKGYADSSDFAVNFPFVPYQFIIMQEVFAQIRKHGNSGKHLSGGERSMLSGFQEAAIAIMKKDEHALVPFFRFYDSVHSFLDSSISRVIERCQKAADDDNGVKQQDVDVLKLLYLIRYVDDIPASVDNIVILMADDIRVDKIALRDRVKESLERLLSQGYIGRFGETYNFLTDEEQDIQREINNTVVDTSAIVERIAQMIFVEIYPTKKFRYGKNDDFEFYKMVDGVTIGNSCGGMTLRFLTAASDISEKNDLRLLASSQQQAIVVLAESPYYDNLEHAMKIGKYIKQRNVAHLPKSTQDIIRGHQEEAQRYEQDAIEQLKKSIEGATFYVAGECVDINNGDFKKRIDQALEYLVAQVYNKHGFITKRFDSDEDVVAILRGENKTFDGVELNSDATAEVYEYLSLQELQKLPTSMNDIQKRYQEIPYGWKEIDIAAVVALLIAQQKVTIKYGGGTIQPDDPKLLDMLRKKNEIGKTTVSKRVSIGASVIRSIRSLLSEYFDVMDVPSDEDGLVSFIVENFTAQNKRFKELDARYSAPNRKYPDRRLVTKGIELTADILSQSKDNFALIERVLKCENDLFDNKEDLQKVESFFKNQVQIFDAATQMLIDLKNDLDDLNRETTAKDALEEIVKIVTPEKNFDYKKIPALNGLMTTVREVHERLLASKRKELLDDVPQYVAAIQQYAAAQEVPEDNFTIKDVVTEAEEFYGQKKEQIDECDSLALLDGLKSKMQQHKDDACSKIDKALKPSPTVFFPTAHDVNNETPASGPEKIVKTCQRGVLFPVKELSSEADVDAYVELVRNALINILKECDCIQLK